MSNYTKATNFATKDALTTGNPLKTLSGTELDDEFNSIATANATKANANNAALTGVPVAPTAAADTSTTQLATTAFVTTEANLKADLASPTFTGNVGISNSSPLFGLSLAQGSGDGNKIGWNDGGGNKRASILANSSNDNLEFRVGTSDTLAMTIDNTGNMSVGTVTADGLTVQPDSGSTTALLTLNNGDGNGTLSQINMGYSGDPDHGNISYTGAMSFTTSAAERMRIDSAGNVGIGTSSPSKTLDVRANSAGEAAVTKISNEYTGGTAVASLEFGSAGGAVKASIAAAVYADGYMAFRTNDNTEKMRITAAGELLVGTTSTTPQTGDHGFVARATGYTIASADNARVMLINRGTSDGELVNFQKDGTTVGSIGSRSSGSALQIYTASTGIDFAGDGLLPMVGSTITDASRDIGSSDYRFKDAYLSGQVNTGTLVTTGNVLVGKTAANSYNTVAGHELQSSGLITATRAGTPTILNRLSSDGDIALFRKDGTTVGSISVTGSATSYNTSSDYRLKTDWQPITGATATFMQLKPVNFEWIADGTRVDGFLAHELQEVIPEAATGTHNGMMDEEYQVSPATGDVFTAGSEAGFNEVSPEVVGGPAYYDINGVQIRAEIIAESAVHESFDAVAEVIHSADVEQPETLEDGQQWRETTAQVMATRSVPDMQGIDQSKVVPILVATLQEAISTIAAMEVRLAALEA